MQASLALPAEFGEPGYPAARLAAGAPGPVPETTVAQEVLFSDEGVPCESTLSGEVDFPDKPTL